MSIKWIGALLILIGSGGCGLGMAASYRREERLLKSLCRSLEFMSCDLSYQHSALPVLCRNISNALHGEIGCLFLKLARELENQVCPDAPSCMEAVIAKSDLPDSAAEVLCQLGAGLGRFDLEGQIQGIESALKTAQMHFANIFEQRKSRLRSYQTLALCAGASLIILFL